ncbi:hypothetical protein Ais01nite_54730 [Asanoa ishikariensis]|uniref:Uncharacterized protein n=1 Tax=Asanoa ishikariensis TaxID=137265 RepID=A0A1H3TT75_9ACTN|nr:hypothetical protein [Asanoa ishikariensis]GIF67438.1 hypothetical protein Ais01nite_54730 [Asanoa ishikariensis]SDZ53356.1 hypothetical protein SAMN05421684_6335 [Asanoa ishikariensis]
MEMRRSVRGLLLLAAAALVVAFVAIAGYPRLVSAGITGGLTSAVRAVGIAAFVLAPILAVSALLRQLLYRP